ncbi:hypothetical protein VTJ83DRAFT_7135 [Remersonia thermophila]|uniref:DNA-binding protein RAP1 n=1 Tax=Remersonia thermophila TaxID=72144 RepID=A0ABR4D2M2_9PEZI
MAASVVYDGVRGKYEGTLFNGIKFWVAERVPMRSTIEGYIKDNGGKLVLLPAPADVLVADHARKKDAPLHSVSWRYITESVKAGELANMDDFRIHPLPNSTQPAASSQPARGTRTPFTEEDNRILVTWVLTHRDNTAGNKIYQDLAALYPRHTWQSWRDRWVKQYAHLPTSQLPAPFADDELPRPAPAPEPRLAQSPRPTAPSPTPAAFQSGGCSPRPQRWRAVKVPFDAHDDQILREYVPACEAAGYKDKGNKIYMKLAEHYPDHTYHSWRDRWVVFVKGSLRGQPPPPPSDTIQAIVDELVREDREKRHAPRRRLPPVLGPATAASLPSTNPEPAVVRAARRQPERPRRPPPDAPEEPEEPDEPQKPQQSKPTQSKRQGKKPEPVSTVETAARDTPKPRSAASKGSASASQLAEQEFWTLFGNYTATVGAAVATWAQVGKHAVNLWDLWQCATEDEEDHDHRDWKHVAEKLELNWIDEPKVPGQLMAAFERHLYEFECFKREFDETEQREAEEQEPEEEVPEAEEEEEEAVKEEAVEEEEEAEEQEEEDEENEKDKEEEEAKQPDFKSSPPVVNVKRPRSSFGTSPLSVRKRPRYDASSEIPETPDTCAERAGRALARRRAAPSETPSRRVRISYDASTTLAVRNTATPESEGGLSPSEQLLSELELSARKPRQSAQPIHTTKDSSTSDDESSDAFESMQDLPVPKTRRSLPWQTAATTTTTTTTTATRSNPGAPQQRPQATPAPPPAPQPAPRSTPYLSSSRLQPQPQTPATPSPQPIPRPAAAASSSSSAANRLSSRSVTPSQPLPRPQPRSRPAPRPIINPGELISELIGRGIPPNMAARAVRATTCHRELALKVARALAANRGVPRRERGVWTDEDDAALRAVGEAVDRMGGELPRPTDMRAFGNRLLAFEGFWNLVEKHGGKGVFERWEFLKALDAA